MADDYKNRILSRRLGVGLGDRPTPGDIDDLQRRQAEHRRRTQPKPKEPFAALLEREGQRHQSGHDGGPEEGQESEEPQPPEGAENVQESAPGARGPYRPRDVRGPPQRGGKRFIKA